MQGFSCSIQVGLKSKTLPIGSNLQWNQTGIVVAGTSSGGRAANQLDQPYGLYIDATGVMYICDYNSNRIQK